MLLLLRLQLFIWHQYSAYMCWRSLFLTLFSWLYFFFVLFCLIKNKKQKNANMRMFAGENFNCHSRFYFVRACVCSFPLPLNFDWLLDFFANEINIYIFRIVRSTTTTCHLTGNVTSSICLWHTLTHMNKNKHTFEVAVTSQVHEFLWNEASDGRTRTISSRNESENKNGKVFVLLFFDKFIFLISN